MKRLTDIMSGYPHHQTVAGGVEEKLTHIMSQRNTNSKYSDQKCPKIANKIGKNGYFWLFK